MLNRKYFLGSFLLLTVCVNSVNGQTAKANISSGDKAFTSGSYYAAVDLYTKALNAEPDNMHATYQLAESYRLSRDYVNAAHWYDKVKTTDAKTYPLAQFWFAMCLKMTANYDKAKEEFQGFATAYKKGPDPYYKKKTALEIKACDEAKKIMEEEVPIKISNLGQGVNTVHSEFAPIYFRQDTLIYTSAQQDSANKKNPKVSADIFKVEKTTSGWGTPINMGLPFNSIQNDGNGCFSSDGKKFYFTRCGDIKNTGTECSIYASTQDENGIWSKPELLQKEINVPQTITTQPHIISIGKKGELMYFVSNRTGGKGGLDIWFTTISPLGEFSAPQNVGTKINTPDNEMSPFYHTSTKTLYFSSDGKGGLGGYDIYKTPGAQRKWSDVENLGYPLNTSVDDIFYIASEDSSEGFFSSNREGGVSEPGKTCCYDLYTFKWTGTPKKKIEAPTLKLTVNGLVIDSKTKSSVGDADVVLVDAETGTEISSDKTVKDEMFLFDLQPDKKYKLKASAPNYLTGESQPFNTLGKKTSETLRMDVPIEPLKVDTGYVLKNIYYDFNKATLRSESMAMLDSLVMFLNQNPNMEIEIGAHTDNKGTDEYNITLSQARAKSVVDYLISKEIPKKRLSAKGYGETKPITTNDTDEERQMNRRTEFKIIKMQ